jgi:hypothetical protein
VGEHLVPRMACGRHWYQCPFGMIEILFPNGLWCLLEPSRPAYPR